MRLTSISTPYRVLNPKATPFRALQPVLNTKPRFGDLTFPIIVISSLAGGVSLTMAGLGIRMRRQVDHVLNHPSWTEAEKVSRLIDMLNNQPRFLKGYADDMRCFIIEWSAPRIQNNYQRYRLFHAAEAYDTPDMRRTLEDAKSRTVPQRDSSV